MKEYYDSHYADMEVQPIVIMQRTSTREEFKGFLYNTAAKYHYRAGHKQGEAYEKDITKRDRYLSWLYAFYEKGEIIDPSKDYELPEVYKEVMVYNMDFARNILEKCNEK